MTHPNNLQNHTIQKAIDRAIRMQLSVNKNANFLYCDLKAIAKIDKNFVAALEQAVDHPIDEVEMDLRAVYAARECLKTIYRLNQYLHISTAQVEELKQIYTNSWRQFVQLGDIEDVLISFHYPQLQKWIASLYPPQFLPVFKSTPVIKPVLNEQYSPAFQLELLGIDPVNLQQPILDIGCGSQGQLVDYLRQMGLQAYGVDRIIDRQNKHLTEADWFEFNFTKGAWGSIISNIAFSNHYQYIRLHEPHNIPQYSKLYLSILDSLQEFGIFYYAPPAPELEKALDRTNFTIRSHQINGVGYSVHVQRNSFSQ